MDLHRLPATEAAVRRYVEDLWLPYHRELESTVERHALADDVDLVAEETAFRLDRLADESNRAWVAVEGPVGGTDGADGGRVDLSDEAVDLAGFVTCEVDEASPVFDRPDRLVVGDLYVRERVRGTGLADRLLDRAAAWARELGCGALGLDVDADNGRALAFYEKQGFEPVRHRMARAVGDR